MSKKIKQITADEKLFRWGIWPSAKTKSTVLFIQPERERERYTTELIIYLVPNKHFLMEIGSRDNADHRRLCTRMNRRPRCSKKKVRGITENVHFLIVKISYSQEHIRSARLVKSRESANRTTFSTFERPDWGWKSTYKQIYFLDMLLARWTPHSLILKKETYFGFSSPIYWVYEPWIKGLPV